MDLSLVIPIKQVIDPDTEEKIPWSLDNQIHLELLKQKIIQSGAVLVIIDPLGSFCSGKVNLSKQGDVRKIFNSLNVIVQETLCSVLVICHTTKAVVDEGIKAASGSFQIMASVQVSWLFMKDPNDKTQMLMAMGRNKQGRKKKSLRYKIEPHPWPSEMLAKLDPTDKDLIEDGVGVFVPGKEDSRSADDVLSEKQDQKLSKVGECRNWLRSLCGDHLPKPATKCNRELVQGSSPRIWS